MRYYTIEELSEPAKKLLRTKYTDKEQFGTKQIGLAIRKNGLFTDTQDSKRCI